MKTDTIFSKGRMYEWDVYVDGTFHSTIKADSATHAGDYICRTSAGGIARTRITVKSRN